MKPGFDEVEVRIVVEGGNEGLDHGLLRGPGWGRPVELIGGGPSGTVSWGTVAVLVTEHTRHVSLELGEKGLRLVEGIVQAAIDPEDTVEEGGRR